MASTWQSSRSQDVHMYILFEAVELLNFRLIVVNQNSGNSTAVKFELSVRQNDNFLLT